MAKRKAKPVAASTLPVDETGFVAFIEANPNDTTARAAYADWLEEQNRPLEAAEQRDAAGLSEVQYKLRRKSDGLFSEGSESSHGWGSTKSYRWSTKGKVWHRLEDLRAHLASLRRRLSYGGAGNSGTPWSDLEVVVVEVRAVTLAHLPLTFRKHGQGIDVPAVTIGKPTSPDPA